MAIRPRNFFGREMLRGATIGAFIGGMVFLASRGWGELRIGPDWFHVGVDKWVADLPLPSWIFMVGGGAVLGSVVGVIRCGLARRRTTAMEQFALELDLRYEYEVDQTQLDEGHELFAHWTVGRHGYHGCYRATPMAIADVVETWPSSGSNGQEHKVRRTVAVLPATGLPQFQLEPKTFTNRVVGAMAAGVISFDESTLGSSDAGHVHKFQSRWHLVADQNPVGIIDNPVAENERAVRKLFSPRLMESLNVFGNVYAQARAGQLLVWRKKGFLAPAQRAALIDDAMRVREVLLHGQERAAVRSEEPIAGDNPAKRSQRAMGLAFGAAAGFMLGFFGGFGVFVWLMESRALDAGPGPIFLMPLLAFGGAGIMAIVGALVGRWLSGFLRAPPSALEHSKRTPPALLSIWRGLGLFVGFGAGAFAGVGLVAMLHQLFGEASGPPWLMIPLFFSCPIGGAIAGLWTGGRIERFLQKK